MTYKIISSLYLSACSSRHVRATAYLMPPLGHLISTSNLCSKGILDFPFPAVSTISVNDTPFIQLLKPKFRSHLWLLFFTHSTYIILSAVNSIFKIYNKATHSHHFHSYHCTQTITTSYRPQQWLHKYSPCFSFCIPTASFPHGSYRDLLKTYPVRAQNPQRIPQR